MATENVFSAENQQERPLGWLEKIPSELRYYLTGFTDGEGSFNVSYAKKLTTT